MDYIGTALKYYITVFSIFYGSAIAMHVSGLSKTLTRNPNAVLIFNGLFLLFTLSVAYKLSDEDFVGLLGFRREGFWRSLIYTGALLGIGITLALFYHQFSINEIVRTAIEHAKAGRWPTWIDYTNPVLLPVYALIIWSISGVLFFALLVAYPYEILGAKYLPLISLMFVLIYNLPLITGEWILDDIGGVRYPLSPNIPPDKKFPRLNRIIRPSL